ncbi:helix-turn-helix transcriptional regulator [Mesorhizobium sp. M1B.F.Ca.ET.045.04.1.1]|uniref:helix-turn-helix domain-containing protein n=1 Tax=unclassified Mesorhizobium TaxID=325217 RepID=UPI000F7528A1|nr:XRE family transcriptional regulator [Mesorhizobium sp. M1B.F.Ca.ET.045.04.1.1]RWB20902.1 MAG: XRE family transcriptional regulator [Mesorhizobium sp.]TIS49223.1 MAG: helix-turn-helix transcriptional regulator [Mesorhizobium sp.]TIT98446.1 MAG: helix-turn-helix transcriptional regulator [Mesorhizobium sp.]
MDSRDQLSAEQLRAARALLNWSRVRLAARANLSESTICEFENGFRKTNSRNVSAMRQPLEDAGIAFTDEGFPSLTRSDDQDNGRHADNRTWRRRHIKRAP